MFCFNLYFKCFESDQEEDPRRQDRFVVEVPENDSPPLVLRTIDLHLDADESSISELTRMNHDRITPASQPAASYNSHSVNGSQLDNSAFIRNVVSLDGESISLNPIGYNEVAGVVNTDNSPVIELNPPPVEPSNVAPSAPSSPPADHQTAGEQDRGKQTPPSSWLEGRVRQAPPGYVNSGAKEPPSYEECMNNMKKYDPF
eukprot:sb/3470658/